MKNTTFIILSILVVIGAILIKPQFKIANSADYDHYLKEIHLQAEKETLATRLAFWEKKLEDNPNNTVYEKKLAGLYASAFRLDGDIASLHLSDSLLQRVNRRLPGQVGTLQSLASNAITQHEFNRAEDYLRQAKAIGEKEFISSLMLADVLLEKGQLLEAKMLLREAASPHHFDYLIREVKLYDQSDDLDAAVSSMEEALALAKASGSPATIYWALSNLADMYGHQGKIRQSYSTYLEALRLNPAGLHCLKGIAWIAFSHDDNPQEAKRILSFLDRVHPVPDYQLLLAEIAAYEQDTTARQEYESRFLQQASRPEYGNMYRTYICLLESERGNTASALALASEEVAERPSASSYTLLAWATFHHGNPKGAASILEEHVIGRASEPMGLYHAGIILKDSGQSQAGKAMLQAAQEASFELGPVITDDLKQYLQKGTLAVR